MVLLRRWLGLFPLTPLGVAVLAAAGWAWWGMGIGRGDLLLRTLGSIGLVLGALSLLTVVAGAWPIARRLRALPSDAPLALEVGFPGDTGLALPLPWWLPLLGVTLGWRAPDVVVRTTWARGRLVEHVTPTRRGDAARIVRDVAVEDLFGLARIRFDVAQARRCRFLPSRGALLSVHVVQGMAGGDALAHPDGPAVGDPMDLRTYGAGDPIRFVLWKVFARTRDLVVRTPEQALAPERRTVGYLVAGPGDEPVAGAARVAVETGALGQGWRLGADGAHGVVSERAAAVDLLLASASVPLREGGAGFATFLAGLDGPAPRVMVFVPATPGPWLERVQQACASSPRLVVDFLVCADGIAPARRAGLTDLLLAPRPTSGPPSSDVEGLSKVVTALGGVGRVLLVDRQAGVVHPDAHLHRLRRAS